MFIQIIKNHLSGNMHNEPLDKEKGERIEYGRLCWVGWERVMEGKWGQK